MVLWFGTSQPGNQYTSNEKKLVEPVERKQTDGDWIRGQLHHLTKEQENRFVEFKSLCETEGFYVPKKGEYGEEFDNTLLLRFLRANRFQVPSALDQFRTAQRWRADHGIETIYKQMDVKCYEESRRMFAQWTGQRDRHGLPVYVFPLRYLTKEKMEAYIAKISSSPFSPHVEPPSSTSTQIPSHLIAFHALYENMLSFVLPFCSQLPRPHMEIPISASTHIIDMTGLTLRQFLDIKRYLQSASVLASKNYPETLGHVFIVGAPPTLRAAWRLVKQWLDPETLSKISILSPDKMQQQCLLEYMPPMSIPREYGGTLDWKWGDMPLLDKSARELAGGLYTYKKDDGEFKEFIEGPIIYSRGAIEVVGTVEGNRREGIISTFV